MVIKDYEVCKAFLQNKTSIIKKYNHTSRNGFTFIEVIMSIMIIGIVAVYLATAIPTSLLLTRQTHDISKATDLAQKYFENVRYAMSNPIAYDVVLEGQDPPLEISDDISNNGYFTVTTEVQDLATEVIGGNNVVTLKRVEVNFSKPEYSTPLVSLNTEIARPRQ